MPLDKKLLAEVMQKVAYVPPMALGAPSAPIDSNAMAAMPPPVAPLMPMDPNAAPGAPVPMPPMAPMPGPLPSVDPNAAAMPMPADPNAMAAMPPVPPVDPNVPPAGDIPIPVVLTMQDLEAILSKAKGEEKTDGDSGRVTVKQLAEEFRAFKDEMMDLLGQIAMVIGVPVQEPSAQEAPPPGLVAGEESAPVPPSAVPMLSVPPVANATGVAGPDTVGTAEQKTAAEKKSQEELLKILRQLNSYRS